MFLYFLSSLAGQNISSQTQMTNTIQLTVANLVSLPLFSGNAE